MEVSYCSKNILARQNITVFIVIILPISFSYSIKDNLSRIAKQSRN